MKVKVFSQPIESIHEDFELLESRINDFIEDKKNIKITTSISDNIFDSRYSKIPVYIVMVQYDEL